MDLVSQNSPVISPSLMFKAVLQVDGFESVSQPEIDSVRGAPEIREALDAMTGDDTDGTPVAVAIIRLRDTGDERIYTAERRIHELAIGNEAPCV